MLFELIHLVNLLRKTCDFFILLKDVSRCKVKNTSRYIRNNTLFSEWFLVDDAPSNCIVANSFDEDLLILFMYF
jgi:hypothetical protein